MKHFIAMIVWMTVIWGVPIDTKLYEGENTLAYYEQLSQKLANEIAVDDEGKERLQSEKTLLQQLRSLVTKEPSIQPFNTALIEQEQIKDTEYMKLFDLIASALDQKSKLEANRMFIQEKLAYLKKHVEEIADPQNENLQLYQLQFAYYKLKQHSDGISIQNYEQYITEGQKILSMLIGRVRFDVKAYEVAIEKYQNMLEQLNKKLIAAKLSQERELLSQETISAKLAKRLDSVQHEHDEMVRMTIEKRLLAGLYHFQQKNIQAVLSQDKEIRNLLKQLSIEDALYTAKLTELEILTKGSGDTINYNVWKIKENLLTTYENLATYIRKPFVVLDESPISFLSILKVLGILFVGFFVAKIYFILFTKLHKKRKDMKAVSIKIVANIGSTLILFVAFVVALSSIGLSIANLAVLAGALSIGAGFALRSIVSSMISGMVLLGENYIKIGDYIRIDDKLTGKVIDIGFRATVLRTIDNIDIIVPNSDLIDGQVINLTFEDRIRRIYVPFKVPYGSDVKKVRTLVVEAVMAATEIKLLRDVRGKKPTVWMADMGESYIGLELLVWVEGIRPSTKSNLLVLIYETLSANGIAMPYPQLDLHIKDKRVLNALR
ncbi:MAG: mechanosensitive ion channel [Campylobacterales bacterium]|nr:mechanosensitive ion channel [Campylobacterales bacterium]